MDNANPLTSFKIQFLDNMLPADSVIVFGDIYIVEGVYAEYCLGSAKHVTLIDAIETPGWQERRLSNLALDYYKGDFSDPFFMQKIPKGFDVGVAYDALLHQPALLQSLHLMLERVGDKFAVVQPMLDELEVPNTLVYLPGNPDPKMHPVPQGDSQFPGFDPQEVNPAALDLGDDPVVLLLCGRGGGLPRHQPADVEPVPGQPAMAVVGMRRDARQRHPAGTLERVPFPHRVRGPDRQPAGRRQRRGRTGICAPTAR